MNSGAGLVFTRRQEAGIGDWCRLKRCQCCDVSGASFLLIKHLSLKACVPECVLVPGKEDMGGC